MAKDEKKTIKNNKKKNTKKKNNTPKESYFKQVNKELHLVKWPTAKEVVKYTIATIVLCLILSLLFILLNFLLSVIKGWFV